MDARRPQGWMLVAAAAILWGTLGPAFKGLGDLGVRPVQVGLWRAVLAGGVFFLWLALCRPTLLRIQARHLPLFVGYGVVSVAIFFVVYAAAVQLSTVAIAAVLLYTAPAWVALLAFFVFREPLTPRKGIAILMTFFGTALVAGAYDLSALRGNGWGITAGLASGITYAMFSIFGKAALRHYPPATAMLYALTFGALFLLPLALRDLASLVAPLRTPYGVALLLYVGLVPTAGSFALYSTGLQRLNDAGRASVIATIEPLVAALLGYVVLGEALAAAQWLGGAFILAGVLVLQGDDGPRTTDRNG